MKQIIIISCAALLFLNSCTKSKIVQPSTTVSTSLKADSVSLYAGSTTDVTFANGPVLSATFSEPSSLATDGSGNVYVADASNNRIRKITPDGIVSTYAGNGIKGYVDGNAATAEFSLPTNVAADSAGNVFVTEIGNSYIRKITPQGNVSTVADGLFGAMAIDAAGNLYACGSNVITELTVKGVLQVFAGSGIFGSQDGSVASATFNGPQGIAVDGAGNLYVADGGNNLIRKISKGMVTTIAGSGKTGAIDGAALSASFDGPKDLVLDPWGNIYVTDQINFKIRKITPAGQVSTFAGNGNATLVNGPALSASFDFPQGMTLTPAGYFLVAEGGPFVIRKISTNTIKQ